VKLARSLALFEAALERPPGERHAFVQASADSAELATEVQALLAAHAASEGFLDPPAEAGMPASIGPWRLLALIGSGGMGRVWRAERDDGAFHQQVAIKVMAGVLGDAGALLRAAAERQFLAALDHPNITRIIDGGLTAAGQPFVVMEYVEGQRIDRWCAARSLDVRARVQLFLQVLSAVDAAHRALIVHRDLKPANVLVASSGQVKLLDFGIAKSLDGGVGSALTGTGIAPMTPEYASPEQLQGKPPTTACDVWALGVLLYELLTGQLPFDLRGVALAEMLPRLQHAPTTRPSQRLDASKLQLDGSAARHWRQQLAGDLDRVLLQALAFEPDRRYGSVRALADDLQRWLDHQPVLANDGGAAYRFGKFVRRHRLPVAAAAAAVLALMVGLVAVAQQARIARAQAARAQATADFLGELIGWADPVASGKEPTLREALDRAAAGLDQRFAEQPDLEADIRLALGQGYVSLLALEPARRELTRVLALRAPGSSGWAQAQVAMASVDWSSGRTDSAEQRYKDALAVYARESATTVPHGEAWNDYAAMLNDLGRYDEAYDAAVHAVALVDVQADPRVHAACVANRAYAEDGLGRFAEAERSYALSTAIYERGLPATAVSLSINLNNQAMLLRGMQRIADALPLFERAIETRLQALPADHASFGTLYANLAGARLELGDVVGAQRDITRALSIAEQHFAPDYLPLGHTHAMAARVAQAAGQREQAIAQARAALAVYARADSVEPARRQRMFDLLAALGAAP
jgi:serine/threonine-protein kinase